MATSDNVLLLGLSGSIGGIMTVKKYKDKVVVCKKILERKKPASKAQEDNEFIFQWANACAKVIYRDPVQREEARLRLKVPHGNELYRALVKECRTKYYD